jgi:hypothetical protein
MDNKVQISSSEGKVMFLKKRTENKEVSYFLSEE